MWQEGPGRRSVEDIDTSSRVAYPSTPLAACALPKHSTVGCIFRTEIVGERASLPKDEDNRAFSVPCSETCTQVTDIKAVRAPSGYSRVSPASKACCSLLKRGEVSVRQRQKRPHRPTGAKHSQNQT